MREHSEFEFTCECGHAIVTSARDMQCPECGRLILLEWGRPHAPEPEQKP